MYVDLRETASYSALIPLSGGMSFLSTQYGWAANNVVNFEVVLANGTVVNANAKENTGKKYASQSSARFY